MKKSFATTFGSPDFRFNFPIDDMQKLSIEQTNPTANGMILVRFPFILCSLHTLFEHSNFKRIYTYIACFSKILDVQASNGSTTCESTNTELQHIVDASVDDKANSEKSNTQTQNECANDNKLDASSIEPTNPFIKSKLHITDNSFKFNFSIECD